MFPFRAHAFKFVGGWWVALGFAAAACWGQSSVPSFTRNASVHDPSILRDGAYYYVFGSHLASARSTDLMGWTQLSSSPVAGNVMAPDPQTTFAEAIAWIGGGSNFWAPDVHRLADGRYYLYYCLCEGTSPRSALGLAVADAPGGPYADLGVLLKSGMWGEASPDGTIYDATRHPNAVDPCVFDDAQGRLWMVYGSYSGGVFILRLDPATGRPIAGQGYGKKLIGGNHARIEAPYILRHPVSGYYYLFLSYGGLAADGGYQVRVGRSVNPDGPFYDPSGTNLAAVAGAPGTFFDDVSIAPHGAKLMGNYQFARVDGEPAVTTRGYLSPGHNSAWFDTASGRAYLIFHTRFVGRGEQHEVRVHRLYFNADGWPVVAPHRYAGETDPVFTPSQIPGGYKLINHGKDISSALHVSSRITLGPDGTIGGDSAGTWTLVGEAQATLTIDGTTYRGVFTRNWDDDNKVWARTFTALSSAGVAVWGSEVAAPNAAPVFAAQADVAVTLGTAFNRRVAASDADYAQTVSYALAAAPLGAAINAATGEITWTPLLAHAGRSHRFTVRATDDGASPQTSEATFHVSVVAANELRRTDLEFDAAGLAGLRDAAGVPTGLTARLSGTGTSVPANDPLLTLETAGTGALALTSTQADYNGGAGLATNRSVGLALSALGFTGAQDFAVMAQFRTPPTLANVDQIGLFVGANASTLTRAGLIRFGTAAPEAYSVHTRSSVDTAGRFAGVVSLADGLTVLIQRRGGVWRYQIDGVDWMPRLSGADNAPVFLDAFADLTVGVFAITPFNATAKTVRLESLSVVVDQGTPPPTALEQWREARFGTRADAGAAADLADPDGDGLANLLEYGLGADPWVASSAAWPVAGRVGAEGRLSLTFNRIADPALVYAVEASSGPGGPYASIWTSTGTANLAGPVTVVDPAVVFPRFLRLRVTR